MEYKVLALRFWGQNRQAGMSQLSSPLSSNIAITQTKSEDGWLSGHTQQLIQNLQDPLGKICYAAKTQQNQASASPRVGTNDGGALEPRDGEESLTPHAGAWTAPKHSLLPTSTADLAVIAERGYHLIRMMLGKEVLDRKFLQWKGHPWQLSSSAWAQTIHHDQLPHLQQLNYL